MRNVRNMGAEALTDVELLAILLRTGTRGENALCLARRHFVPCRRNRDPGNPSVQP